MGVTPSKDQIPQTEACATFSLILHQMGLRRDRLFPRCKSRLLSRPRYLTPGKVRVNFPFYLWTLMQTVSNTTLLAAANATEETQHDFDFPQREAAFFYGLFLRGHSAEELRRDIEVPPAVLLKWHRESERDPTLRDVFTRMVDYRRHVLAIFEALVDTESRPQRVQ